MQPDSSSFASPAFFVGPIPVYGTAVLSPMDGYSDLPFRSICRELGSAMSYSEFIGAIGILGGYPHLEDKLVYLPQEHPVVYQIFDNDPDRLLEAALHLEAGQIAPGYKPDIIDVNLGCSDRSVSNRGAGAGLLRTPHLIADIFQKLTRHLHLPVTAKIRLGWDHASRNYLEVARILEDNGAALIAVHGRTRSQGYTGKADWDAIAEVVQAVSIPVLGNGDVRTVADMDRLKAHTGCAGVMIGRSAVANPWLFARLDRGQVALDQVRSTMYAHLQRNLDYFGLHLGLLRFRKNADTYLRPYGLFSELRHSLLTTTDVDQFKALVEKVLSSPFIA